MPQLLFRGPLDGRRLAGNGLFWKVLEARGDFLKESVQQ
jgi:hypothetical protein